MEIKNLGVLTIVFAILIFGGVFMADSGNVFAQCPATASIPCIDRDGDGDQDNNDCDAARLSADLGYSKVCVFSGGVSTLQDFGLARTCNNSGTPANPADDYCEHNSSGCMFGCNVWCDGCAAPPVCVPNGCGGGCPANCGGGDDPDCPGGCLDCSCATETDCASTCAGGDGCCAACAADPDCAAGPCVNGTCAGANICVGGAWVPHCTTGAQDCDETGIDCGGASCAACAAGPSGSSSGLIPCGRDADDGNTPWVETDPCTLCHIILMGQLIIEFLVKMAAIFAILALVGGGLVYVFAAGRQGTIEKAKTMIKYALLGFVVVFIAWAVISSILAMMGYIDPIGGEWHMMDC